MAKRNKDDDARHCRKWLMGGALTGMMLLVGGCGATMAIESDPPGALVIVDGKEVGRTPMKFQASTIGTPSSYAITLEKTGYESTTQTVENTTDYFGAVKWPEKVSATLKKSAE